MSHVSTTSVELGRYWQSLAAIPLLTVEEEQQIARLGTPAARQRLVRHNLRFVVKIAFRFQGYGFEILDLVQEGNIGLMQAAEKFDPARNVRFCTYAVWWIRAFIQKYVLQNWSLVRIGTTQGQRKVFFSLARTCRELEKLGVPAELVLPKAAKQLHVSLRECQQMQDRLRARDVSLDAPVGEDDEHDLTFVDLLEAPGENTEAKVVGVRHAAWVRGEVEAALSLLRPRERRTIEQYVMWDETRTLNEIGADYGVSRERARQIANVAKDKLRLALQKVGT